jgi:arylsulfatase A
MKSSVAILALFLFVSIPAQSPAAEPPPNIVFVLVDDMGYGDLGCTSVDDIRTPHIDRIAANGVQESKRGRG